MNIQPAPAAAPGKPNLRLWSLRVVDARDADPNIRRVTFTADDIGELDYRPGRAIVFAMPLGNGETGRRHYTIRGVDRAAGSIWVDFFRHGSSPSVDWAIAARPGDTIEARGPRGGAWVRPDAAWHLVTADETGIPAAAHMLETMPADARGTVLIAVANPAHRLPVAAPAGVEIVWLDRMAGSDATLDALSRWTPPAGRGHAILMGETGSVRAQRHALIARGLDRQQISSEGYWRAGRVGGHDHVDD